MNVHLHCPHCKNPIELVDLQPEQEVTCTACGSSFRLENLATTSWAPAGTAVGRFQVVEEVGHGGFGTVYKARDPQLDRTVAIKVPRRSNIGDKPQDLERFIREARSVAQLRHPSIVSVHEVGTLDLPPSPLGGEGTGVRGEGPRMPEALPYLVTDFIEGVTLADLLTARRPPPREAAKLIAAVAEALHYAHERGVVHRDIKPSNIMIRPDGSPVVMDFGLAKRDAGEITMTMDGEVLGTPAYMSPEQARGEGHKVDGRSDVYSLGVVLYQLLTEELPFRGNKRMLLYQVMNEEPRSPRSLNDQISRDLETITLKTMSKESGGRYATAKELADELRRFLNGDPILARPVARMERLARWCRRNPSVASLLGAVILSLGVGLAGSMYFAINASKERDTAERNAKKAEDNEKATFKALEQAQEALKQTEIVSGFVVETIAHRKRLTPYNYVYFTGADQILQKSRITSPITRGNLLYALGATTLDRGDFGKAEEYLDGALAIRRECLGDENLDTAVAMDELAQVYRTIGKLPRAVGLFEQAAKLRWAKRGPDDVDTLSSRWNLAIAYVAAGKCEDAIPLLEVNTKHRAAFLGATHPETVNSLELLIRAYRASGKHDRELEMVLSSAKTKRASPSIGPHYYQIPLLPGGSDRRVFPVNVNERVSIRVTTERTKADVDLFVERGDGRALASDTRVSKDCFVQFVAPATESYRVRVVNLGPEAATSHVSIDVWVITPVLR